MSAPPQSSPVWPPAPPSSDTQLVVDLVRRHRRGVSLAAVLVVGVAVAIAALLPPPAPDRATAADATAAPLSLQNATITRLTTTGNAGLPALSPDGRFVAYVEGRVGGEQSLWIRQTSTTSDREVVPSRPGVGIVATSVTPDGEYVDYVTEERSPGLAYTLWRVPFNGGTARRLIEDVYSGLAWSSDRRMAFIRVRGRLPVLDLQLVTADYDGSNERILVTRRLPDPVFGAVNAPGARGIRPAWSPDGSVIASLGVAFPEDVPAPYVMFVTVADGSVLAVPQRVVGPLTWLRDSSLLEGRPTAQQGTKQIWQFSYPSGETARLTNDLDGYGHPSAAANGDRFAAVHYEERVAIWVGDGDGRNARVIASPNRAGVSGFSAMVLAWAGDRLLYSGRSGESAMVLESRLDGSEPQELVRDAGGAAATQDGSALVYLSLAEGDSGWLWKAGRDGRRREILVSDGTAWPRVTPDRQVVFVSSLTLRPRMVSLDGGTPRQIADLGARALDVSPDGRAIAILSLTGTNQLDVVVCDLPDCSAQQRFRPPGLADPLSQAGAIRFNPEQTAIAYVNTAARSNIWLQPLDGSPPRPLTDFADDLDTFDFAWSGDGQRLAFARGRVGTDIVLFSDFRSN